jgi:transposase InsO family protein
MDLFSRKIVGWAMRDHLRTELASAALMMQWPAARLIHHSDRGVQYASHDYRAILAATDSSLWRSSSIWSANLAAPWPPISKYAPTGLHLATMPTSLHFFEKGGYINLV